MAKILIVDDAAFIRMRLAKVLERNDIQVIEAEDGNSGVEKFKLEKPDLVLLDITMPDIDGIETFKRLKEVQDDVKVIMLSNVGQQTTIMEAIKLGAKGFIKKPFNEDKLLETIFKLIAPPE